MRLTHIARTVMAKRYLRRKPDGTQETPDEMVRRVARVVAAVDANYGAGPKEVRRTEEDFYNLIDSQDFMPNSPTFTGAGTELGQLSACFVLPVGDSLSEIYETMKQAALIHQTGGGCVAGDAHVYTTFCGVEQISTLYERVRALGVPEEQRPGHRVMDVTHLGIRTFAVDPATGRFQTRQVTHLWQWDVPAEHQYTVRCRDGTEITSSSWHPFLVFTARGIEERRADQLAPGDILLTSNSTVRAAWPFKEPVEVEGLRLDEPLAWLVGFFLGDGSLDRFRNRKARYEALRLRLFDGRPESIRFAAQVLAAHGVEVTPNQDRRGLWRLTTTNQTFVPSFARLAQVTPGPKDDLTLPEWVAKSPLSVIGAFLGGLIDSDGHVSVRRRRVEFTTVCAQLARRLVSLLSALGFNPSMYLKAPGKKGRRVEYRIHLADARRAPELVDLVAEWVHDPLKRERLAALRERPEHDTHLRIPLPFEVLEGLLRAAGVETRDTSIHRLPVRVGGERMWLHRAKWGEGIGADKLRRLVRALRPVVPLAHAQLLEQLEQLAEGWTVVEAVERAQAPKPFYDFTVEGYNNYLAGGGPGKFTVVHNTGFAFSRLRPAGDVVRSSQGVASGPVSFLKVYNASTEAVKQGGTRRGANMGILRVDHPDILEFIHCKDDLTQVTNFNISVAITDRFMEALERDEEYELVNPRNGEVVRKLRARQVWDELIQSAWATGEPGLVFIDRINRRNPNNHVEVIEATNPCGEQPLPPYGSCNLGSINLANFVRNPYTDRADVDWKRLASVVHRATHFLDNVIDANRYPLEQIAEKSRRDRRIGLGVMGWAEMLVQLGLPYDSEEACQMGRRVMSFIKQEALRQSMELAERRGPYPDWEGSKWHKAGLKVRNATLTTVAPTGTISLFAARDDMPCSGGIEPKFAIVFTRNQAGALMLDVDGQFAEIARREGWYSDELMERIAEHGSPRGVDGVPERWQRLFATAHDITPYWHVRMQAAFQGEDDLDVAEQPIDAACSKTINFPHDATADDVREAYELAWKLGLKGITVYRDGARQGQVLTVGKKDEQKEPVTVGAIPAPAAVTATAQVAGATAPAMAAGALPAGAAVVEPPGSAGAAPIQAPAAKGPALSPRPSEATGKMFKIPTHFGNMTLDVHMREDGEPFEVIVSVGAVGSDLMADAVAIGMLISTLLRLRSDVPWRERMEIVIDKLKNIGGSTSSGFGPNRITSLASAVARGLQRFLAWKDAQEAADRPVAAANGHAEVAPAAIEIAAGTDAPAGQRSPKGGADNVNPCPECGAFTLVWGEGCQTCYNCGYSKC